MRRLFAGLIAAAAAFVCFPASAQDSDYPAQVRTYLERGMAPHAARGYRADPAIADVVASLRMGEARLIPVTLQRGENYRIYAACDADCSDLDMEIFGADGNYLERDIGLDATPFVQVTPATTGAHYVRVWLAACENEPCFAAVRAVRGGQPEERVEEPVAGAGDGGEYAAGVRAHLDQALAAGVQAGFMDIPGAPEIAVEPLTINSRGQSRSYVLQAGRTYRFAAACDSDCTDLDIEVADTRGNTLGQNLAIDNPTSVEVTPRAAGTYNVRIWLAACAVEPCYAGQRGMIRGQR